MPERVDLIVDVRSFPRVSVAVCATAPS